MAWVWPCVNKYLQHVKMLLTSPTVSQTLIEKALRNFWWAGDIWVHKCICLEWMEASMCQLQVMCEYLYQQENKVVTIHSHLGQTANENLQGWASEDDLVHDGPIFLFFFHFYLKLMLYHWNLQRHVGIVSYPSQTWVRRTSALWWSYFTVFPG